MLYNSEVTFLGKFIASLKLYNISNIPFDNTDFYAGIESMNVYFQANKSVLGELSDEISMLFIKNPFEQIDNKRFRDVNTLLYVYLFSLFFTIFSSRQKSYSFSEFIEIKRFFTNNLLCKYLIPFQLN